MTTPQSVSTRPSPTIFAARQLQGSDIQPQPADTPARMASRRPLEPENWKKKNLSASQTYEASLDEKSLAGHRANQERIATVIAELRAEFFQINPEAAATDFRTEVASSLENILSNAAFDPAPYISKAANPNDEGFIHGYGKYLLYGDDNLEAPYCLQYFHFSPGQKTPIHDHPVPCISLVTRGKLVERRYSAVSATVARKIASTPRALLDRKSFLDISLPNIHSLKNKHDGIAGSVHFYFIDGDINSRAVKSVYQKAGPESDTH